MLVMFFISISFNIIKEMVFSLFIEYLIKLCFTHKKYKKLRYISQKMLKKYILTWTYDICL